MIKTLCGWMLSGLCLFGSGGCIYVRVTGDLDRQGLGDEDEDAGFHGLRTAVDGLLIDPKFDLKVSHTSWKTEARWTVAYTKAGSDPEAAFLRVQEAIRQRVQEKGGHLVGETKQDVTASPGEAGASSRSRALEWSCAFHLGGERGSASIAFEDRAGDELHPRELVLSWTEDH